jgi:hypothetical protein
VRSAATRRRASISWARLLARIYEHRPLSGPRCQGEMRLLAFLTEAASIRIILAHLGKPTTPPWDPTTPAPDPDRLLITRPSAPRHARGAGSRLLRHDARGDEMLAPMSPSPPLPPTAQRLRAPAMCVPVTQTIARRFQLTSGARSGHASAQLPRYGKGPLKFLPHVLPRFRRMPGKRSRCHYRSTVFANLRNFWNGLTVHAAFQFILQAQDSTVLRVNLSPELLNLRFKATHPRRIVGECA